MARHVNEASEEDTRPSSRNRREETEEKLLLFGDVERCQTIYEAKKAHANREPESRAGYCGLFLLDLSLHSHARVLQLFTVHHIKKICFIKIYT